MVLGISKAQRPNTKIPKDSPDLCLRLDKRGLLVEKPEENEGDSKSTGRRYKRI